jgi:hypothetical protein
VTNATAGSRRGSALLTMNMLEDERSVGDMARRTRFGLCRSSTRPSHASVFSSLLDVVPERSGASHVPAGREGWRHAGGVIQRRGADPCCAGSPRKPLAEAGRGCHQRCDTTDVLRAGGRTPPNSIGGVADGAETEMPHGMRALDRAGCDGHVRARGHACEAFQGVA